MPAMPPDDAIDSLLAGHALGDLDAGERERLAALLRQDPALQERLDEFRTTLEMLPLALPATSSPPDRLRRRILAGQQGGTGQASIRWRGPVRWLGPLLIGAVLLVMGVQLQQTRQQLAGLRRELADLTGQPSISRRLPLRGMDPQGRVRGEVLVSGNRSHNTLIVDGLPAPPPNHSYRLWAKVNGRELGCVYFMPDAEGHVAMQIPTSPTSLASSVSVSLEALDGSGERPNGPRVMSGTI
jgi:anti-sigma factor RsiW